MSKEVRSFLFCRYKEGGGMVVLGLRDIVFLYDRKVILRGINLFIRGGDKVIILGDNGSGKTSLLEIMVGILTPQRGSVVIKEEIRQVIISSYPPFYPYLTGEENIKIWVGFWGSSIDIERLKKLCDRFKLPMEALKRRVVTYSMGERQKLNLIVGFLIEPELLLLDEPTSYLDRDSRGVVLRLIEKYPKSVVCTTNEESFFKQFKGTKYYLRDGYIYEEESISSN